jgi:RecB family endonuclease NucS
MTKAWWICPKCGVAIPFKDMFKHKCNVETEVKPNLDSSTHKDVVEYYALNPSEIEKGMIILYKEFPVLRGRIDLVGRDSEMRMCLIEVVHRSHMDRSYWIKRLRQYQTYLRNIWLNIFHLPSDKLPKFRLILKYTNKPTEEVA